MVSKAPGPSGVSPQPFSLWVISLTSFPPLPQTPISLAISPDPLFYLTCQWFHEGLHGTPGRELADGQGARFLSSSGGQPELLRGLLCISARWYWPILTPPDLLKHQNDKVTSKHDLSLRSNGGKELRHNVSSHSPASASSPDASGKTGFLSTSLPCVFTAPWVLVSVCGRGNGSWKETREFEVHIRLELKSFFFN